jgi:hypothetical protein
MEALQQDSKERLAAPMVSCAFFIQLPRHPPEISPRHQVEQRGEHQAKFAEEPEALAGRKSDRVGGHLLQAKDRNRSQSRRVLRLERGPELDRHEESPDRACPAKQGRTFLAALRRKGFHDRLRRDERKTAKENVEADETPTDELRDQDSGTDCFSFHHNPLLHIHVAVSPSQAPPNNLTDRGCRLTAVRAPVTRAGG